jgi:hypothetical protein
MTQDFPPIDLVCLVKQLVESGSTEIDLNFEGERIEQIVQL